jgi:cyclomaltodextrinase / maltogenic alpha-amylase / neopullulanase
MSLLDHAIWWQVYPLGACGAPIRDAERGVHHRLRRLESWLDYAVELGCSGLLLGPIFTSTSHGYDTLDHFSIDPRLGDDADFDHLLEQAQRRGLSIVLDGVFNHVGAHHDLVRQSVEDDSGLVKLVSGPQGMRPLGWEGHDDLAVLDHDNPAVVELVVEIMLHWLRRGVAGWRLDAAYSVPVSFWATVIGRVRHEFPQAVFIGEVIHGDYAEIVTRGGLDTVTQYELWKATWSSIQDTNFWELAWTLERHQEFSETFVPQTFVGNHDVERIASLVGDSGAVLAAAVLFTVPGMPSIYYGDEQAFRGRKGEGWEADAELRPALPETPDQLAAVGLWLYRVYQDLIGLRRRNPWLTRGSVEIITKENAAIDYRVSGSGHVLTVTMTLAPRRQVVIAVDGEQAFAWSQDH